jgi:hypothetical protein
MLRRSLPAQHYDSERQQLFVKLMSVDARSELAHQSSTASRVRDHDR